MSALELRRETGGLRFYVDGAPLHAGDPIAVRFGDDWWVSGRYEYTTRPIGGELEALFYFWLPGAADDCVIALPRGADVRVLSGARYAP